MGYIHNSFIIVAQFLFFFDFIDGGTKTWRYNTDIFNPQNQIPAFSKCEGIHFAPHNSAPLMIVNRLISTPSIKLPISGNLYLIGKATIEFNRNNKKCLNLKSINYEKWYDHRSWTGDFNEATPHIERIPCFWDDVKFPGIYDTAVDITKPVQVKSIYLKNEKVNAPYLALVINTFEMPFFINSIQDKVDITFSKHLCDDASGCICNPALNFYDICPDTKETINDCVDPIQPYGYCHEICGAAVIMKPQENFNFLQLKNQLNVDKDVEAHVSKVINEFNEPTIQIVFAERNYTGKSIEEANTFFNELLKNPHGYKFTDIKLLTAGVSKIRSNSAAGLFFGTLMGVAATFAIIFFIYSDHNKWIPIRNLNGVYARFETRGSNLIINDMGGSLTNVCHPQNSFENPMFESPGPTTSTDILKSDETVEEHNVEE